MCAYCPRGTQKLASPSENVRSADEDDKNNSESIANADVGKEEDKKEDKEEAV